MCVQSTLTCNRCGHQAVDDEARPFDLICNFSQPLSIVDLINSSQVLGPEKVEGVLCRNDRHSKHRSDHVKTKIIKVAPEILVALIPRFYQDTKGTLCKRQEQIPITPELDLSNFYEGGRTLKYQLFSIINHVGSLRRGHYVAHARGPSGQWEKLDDSTVSWSTLEKATNPDGGFTPYLLFYQKVITIECVIPCQLF